MADQDFVINIRATANTAAIQLTQQQLDALQKAAAEGNKEAIAALKKLEQAQNEADRALTQGIRNASAYGLLIGGFVAKAINDLARAENQVTQELDEQGGKLVSNAQLWASLARNVDDFSDVVALSQKASGEIQKLGDAFNKANTEAKGFWHSFAETALTAIGLVQPQMATAAKTFIDLMNDPKNRQLEGLQQDMADAQASAAHSIVLALKEQEEIRGDLAGYISKENEELERQKATLAGISPEMEQAWASQAKVVDDLEKKIERLTGTLKRQHDQEIRWLEEYDREQEKQRREQERRQTEQKRAQQDQLRDLQSKKSEIESAAGGLSPQAKAVVMQEQAERAARAQGRERDADQFAKSAEDFKRSLTEAQRMELERFRMMQHESKDDKAAREIRELKAYMQSVWGG